MKKLFALTLIGSSLFLGSNPAKADTWDYWATKLISDTYGSEGVGFYTYSSTTGEAILRTSKCVEVTILYGEKRCRTSLETFVENNCDLTLVDKGLTTEDTPPDHNFLIPPEE